jgi:pentatricopeptide repeat protein
VQDLLIAINILQKANLPEPSLGVHTQSPASEVHTGHFDAVASSYEGTYQLKMAPRLLHEMKVARSISSTVTYSVAVDACGKSGEDEKAVKLKIDMQAAETNTGDALYNSATTCTKGDQMVLSPHNPLPVYLSSRKGAVYLSSRKDYSSNTSSNHKQIKPLDRNDRNLAQFGFSCI